MKGTNQSKYIAGILLLVLVMGLGYLAGAASASTDGNSAPSLIERLTGETAPKVRSSTRLIDKALQTLKDQYFQEITPETQQKLIYAGIQGMLSVLRKEPYKDEFTNFYDPDLYSQLESETTGNYAGVGILMSSTPDGSYPEVETVFEGSPAMDGGVLEGDIIVEVAGEDAFQMPLPQVASKIKGEPGTEVKVKMFRPSDGVFNELTLTRRDVHYSSVSKVEMAAPGVGLIKITNFANETGKDFRAGMEKLTGEGMKTLVLDLRDNPGGLLDAAGEVADCFIKEGLIVEVECRTEKTQQSAINAKPDTKKYDLPILIMVNSNTASASEVLTSALRDYGLAKVIGEQSFGKGVVQSVSPLEWLKDENGEVVQKPVTDQNGRIGLQPVPKDALAVVIGKYYTPKRTEIHGVGLKPDLYYDYQNVLLDDPKVKEYQDRVDKMQEELMKLRTEANRYMREHDASRRKALEVAAKLSRGENVANTEKIEPKETERNMMGIPMGGHETKKDSGDSQDSGSADQDAAKEK